MIPKYQISISSTYDDLRHEREQVIKAALEMGHIPVGMEMFSAADEEQWRVIRRHIDESDYYVVLVAHRYGSIVDGISYTRKEYEYALKQRIPILGFIVDPATPWPPGRIEQDTVSRQLLQEFVELIRQKPISHWKTADDLHGKFSIALMKAITFTPRVGWIRATSAASPEVVEELSRLSAENANLRQLVNSSEEDIQANLESLRETMTSLGFRCNHCNSPAGPQTLLAVFEQWLPWLLKSGPQLSLYSVMNSLIHGEESNAFVPWEQFEQSLLDIMAFDLIEIKTPPPPITGPNGYTPEPDTHWGLTSLGRRLVNWQRRAALEGELAASRSNDGATSA